MGAAVSPARRVVTKVGPVSDLVFYLRLNISLNKVILTFINEDR